MQRDLLNLTRLGWSLAIPVLFLVTVGLAAIRATEREEIDVAAPTPASMPVAGWRETLGEVLGSRSVRQLLYAIGGVALMGLMTGPSYLKIGRYAYVAYWTIVGLLLLLVLDHWWDLPLVPVKRNTRRWIGTELLAIQPSEFIKLALILALARYLRFRESVRQWRGLVVPFLLTLLPMVLILFQPDLGTLLMLLPVVLAMLFVAGARRRHLVLVALAGCAALPLLYRYGMHDYQKQRILMLLRQNSDDPDWQRGEGYQLRQSLLALGSGGLWGEGWRQGVFARYALLPEEHNDFIFAIIGNQWGLVGCLAVLAAYAMIVVCGLEVALVTNDPFGRLLAVGVVVMIVAQAFINMGMTVGLAPITGMTLPFVSFGGSSLWANFMALGLLVNIAQRRPMLMANPPFEHED